MPLLFNIHFGLAIDNLRQNRGRTFLSALGIAIGVASIILILSLTGGINKLIGVNSDKNNANLLLVRPSSGKEASSNIIDELASTNQYAKSNLALTDVELISKVEHVSAVAPLASSSAAISVNNKTHQAINLVATTSALPKIISLPMKNGQFLDNNQNKNIAVVGYNLAEQLFGGPEAIAKTFIYNEQTFMIVGVLEKTDNPINYNGIDFDTSILIDINFASKFESSIQIQQINIRTDTTDSVQSVSDTIKAKLIAAKHGDENLQVITSNDNLHPADSLLSIISTMLTLVASISLLVGGVGIMNIMLVSVSERTREIGIRKAVGAAPSHILLQFLFESIILSIVGGLMGFALGYLFAFLISLVTPFAPHISWQILTITGLTSLTAGIVFGVYPAIKAARKDPITSLKYYR
ncbi:ABC transporter permease [Candidatus Saccharibacteria bacterium]|nr:ABC transporter permease [Candidatus Saccharibacteria bacterium]